MNDQRPDMARDPARAYRYRVLDTYRFFAASGIVFYHFCAHYQQFMPWLGAHFEALQYFVDFFFVLSGFVLMHTYGHRPQTWSGYKDFLWKRFARLYPLHFATILLCCLQGGIVIGLGLKVRDPSFYDFSLIPSNLLLVHAWGVNTHTGLNSPSWSLSAEAFVYILFPLLVLVLARTGAWLTIAAAVAFTAATALYRNHYGLGDGTTATYDFGNIRALPAFLIGMATCAVVDRIGSPRVRWLLPNALAVAILVMMASDGPAYVILSLFPLLVGLIAMAERSGAATILATPVFVMLGNASFAIYLTHSYFQAASVPLVRKLGWTTPTDLACAATFVFVVIVGCGVLSFMYFETPSRKALTRLRLFGADEESASCRACWPIHERLHALCFPRFREPMSAISMGPRLNSLTSAFRVRLRI